MKVDVLEILTGEGDRIRKNSQLVAASIEYTKLRYSLKCLKIVKGGKQKRCEGCMQ